MSLYDVRNVHCVVHFSVRIFFVLAIIMGQKLFIPGLKYFITHFRDGKPS